MSCSSASVPAVTPGATVEVRQDGELIARVNAEAAQLLLNRGWAVARGERVLKYLALKPDAPWRPPARGWNGGSHTTERMRNDQDVTIGAPKSGLQHKPLPGR